MRFALRVSVIVMGFVFFASQEVQAALQAFYTFEGNANDVSGNGNDGTVFGATGTASGFEGSAFQFNGTGNYIEIPINVNPGVLPQLTWGAWVNADVNNGIRQVLSHDNGGFDRSLGMDGRGGGGVPPDWSSFMGTGVLGSGVDVVTGDWVFLAAVYDQTTNSVRLHVDDLSVTVSGSFGSGHNTVRIGSNPSFGEFFGGRIDNVFIYDEALSVSRIEEIRLGGAGAIQAAIPEPTTFVVWSLLASLGLSFGWRRRRRTA